jgi:hypothetical protein
MLSMRRAFDCINQKAAETNANVTWTEIDLLPKEISETQTLWSDLKKQNSGRGRISSDIVETWEITKEEIK